MASECDESDSDLVSPKLGHTHNHPLFFCTYSWEKFQSTASLPASAWHVLLAQVCPGHNGLLCAPEQLVTGGKFMLK